MKKILKISKIVLAAGLITSCSVTLPVAVSSAPIGSKTGVSKSTVICGNLWLNKTYGAAEAAKNGKLTGGVATIDEKTTNYIIFQKKELIVTGN